MGFEDFNYKVFNQYVLVQQDNDHPETVKIRKETSQVV